MLAKLCFPAVDRKLICSATSCACYRMVLLPTPARSLPDIQGAVKDDAVERIVSVAQSLCGYTPVGSWLQLQDKDVVVQSHDQAGCGAMKIETAGVAVQT